MSLFLLTERLYTSCSLTVKKDKPVTMVITTNSKWRFHNFSMLRGRGHWGKTDQLFGTSEQINCSKKNFFGVNSYQPLLHSMTLAWEQDWQTTLSGNSSNECSKTKGLTVCHWWSKNESTLMRLSGISKACLSYKNQHSLSYLVQKKHIVYVHYCVGQHVRSGR